MNQTYKLTIADYIEMFLKGKNKGVAVLKDIYEFVKTYLPDTAEETIRCSIYRDSKNRFKRVGKGMYMLVGENTASLLIKGDGRGLEELEDESIDCIITDHPWEDKFHKSGNQKELAKYDKFKYNQQDFYNKARVLKEGCFLAEFIPLERENNYQYLYEIKQMAKRAGLNYYAKIMWVKDEGKNRCTGRMTKEAEEIMIFYKGKKPRKLSRPEVDAYKTREILPLFNTYFASKGKKKNHDSEKPIALYQFLIRMLTEENEVVLDQFGGSCNLLKAAINENRFAIVYEIFKDFVQKAVNRFNCIPLVEDDECINYKEEFKSKKIDSLIVDVELDGEVNEYIDGNNFIYDDTLNITEVSPQQLNFFN